MRRAMLAHGLGNTELGVADSIVTAKPIVQAD